MVRLWLLVLVALPFSAQTDVPLDQYKTRRDDLRKVLANSAIILYGRTEREADVRTAFFQDSNFFYLTGWREPGAVLVILPAEAKPNEILFIPKRNKEAEKWTGRKAAPEDEGVAERAGFTTVWETETIKAKLPDLVKDAAKIYTQRPDPGFAKLKDALPNREFEDAKLAIARLRMRKSPQELALLQRSIDATIAAHQAAWKRAAAGLYEYQVAASMVQVYSEKGCERHAYAPIVGSGPNGAILHYARNSRRIDRGELLLMDVGAECSGYAADITRTIPIGGKFSARQRELYEIVLGAQKAAFAALKPGMTLGRTTPNSLHKIALEYFNTHGKDLHGEPLGKYFTHGLGHHVGLDVHDANDPAQPLEPGMVITLEPGLYIPEENIGIRIEDMFLLTETGSKLLSGALPREPDAVEHSLASDTHP
jgi:Xaa-Pro aminopeptidase